MTKRGRKLMKDGKVAGSTVVDINPTSLVQFGKKKTILEKLGSGNKEDALDEENADKVGELEEKKKVGIAEDENEGKKGKVPDLGNKNKMERKKTLRPGKKKPEPKEEAKVEEKV